MRYFIKAKPKLFDVDDWDGDPFIPSLTVYDDEEVTFTGLIDVDGNEIHRTEKAPMGFLTEILE